MEIAYRNPLEQVYDSFRKALNTSEIDLTSREPWKPSSPTIRGYTPAGRKQVITKLRRKLEAELALIEKVSPDFFAH